MNLNDTYSPDAIDRARQELRREASRYEVERVKAILKSREARWIRFTRFWSLIKAAFNELFGTSS